MKEIKQLIEMFKPAFEKCNVKLYEMKWTGSKTNLTLEVSITKDDGTMDLDTCALVSEELSNILDADNSINEAYTLEVCSPGAEREIRDLEELGSIQNPYVYIKFKNPQNKLNDVTGSVNSFDGEIIELSYRDKQATKVMQINKDNISYIRLAVKI